MAAKPTPTGGAGTAFVAQCGCVGRFDGHLDDVGPLGQGGLEGCDVAGCGALLRPVHRGRAARTEQRVVDVAGHDEIGASQAGVEPAEVEVVESSQRGAAAGQLVAVHVRDGRVRT